jgi:hypothetical protein
MSAGSPGGRQRLRPGEADALGRAASAHDARPVHAVYLVQGREVDVESFPVVVGPEVVEPRIRNRSGVQRIRVEWAVGGQRGHRVADLLGLGAELGLG